ncbi:hypothetical protein [Azospirillum agricola]|uniref:hypothetical protein n=1 Tax=Azospirillum agricola TaxID=1720247 RepID=UPI000A0F312F|nr:hypothetical protein [Azospirillum agricola]SMH62861.1 hypothetical protein SAMN02982994_6684 [Azospirillum lipoferum]
MPRDTAALALSLGVAAQRLHQGRALDGASRAQLARLLLRAAMALTGVTPPVRLDADPRALFDVTMDLCREAGVTPGDLAAWFNDAAERNVGPLTRRAP